MLFVTLAPVRCTRLLPGTWSRPYPPRLYGFLALLFSVECRQTKTGVRTCVFIYFFICSGKKNVQVFWKCSVLTIKAKSSFLFWLATISKS